MNLKKVQKCAATGKTGPLLCQLGPNSDIHYGIQWGAVTSETGHALGMPKLVMQLVFYG